MSEKKNNMNFNKIGIITNNKYIHNNSMVLKQLEILKYEKNIYLNLMYTTNGN